MKIGNVTFDCADPDRMSTFWAAVLGYEKAVFPDDLRKQLLDSGLTEDDLAARGLAEDPAGVGPRLFFHRVPEGKFGELRSDRSVLSCGDGSRSLRRTLVGMTVSSPGGVHDAGHSQGPEVAREEVSA